MEWNLAKGKVGSIINRYCQIKVTTQWKGFGDQKVIELIVKIFKVQCNNKYCVIGWREWVWAGDVKICGNPLMTLPINIELIIDSPFYSSGMDKRGSIKGLNQWH